MNTMEEKRYIRALGHAIQGEAYLRSPMPPRGKPMDLRCPDCNSSDLKRLSLVYQGGLSRVKTRSRLLALVFGKGGPDLVVGRAAAHGIQQTELSRTRKPPVKWSYRRLVFRAMALTFVALGAYIVFVASGTPPVSTLPLKLYVFLAPVVFLVLAFAVWRHNYLRFPQEYARWDRSFICQRCGAICQNEVP
jgi:hypothetical protein